MKTEQLKEAMDFLDWCYQHSTQDEREAIRQIPVWVDFNRYNFPTKQKTTTNTILEASDDTVNDICAISFLADDCWIGASKVVFHSNSYCPDLVFKIPLSRIESWYTNDEGKLTLDKSSSYDLFNACSEEETLYQDMDESIQPFFLETCYVNNSEQLFDIPIYVSPYIKHQPDSNYHFWKSVSKSNKDYENFITTSQNIVQDMRRGDVDEEVIAALLATTTKDTVDKIVNFIEENDIDDIMPHNILYQNDKCYIMDYAGFARIIMRYLDEYYD